MKDEEKKDVKTTPESAPATKPETKPEPTPEAIAKKLRDKDDLRTFGIALIAAVIVVAGYHITRQLVRVIIRCNNPAAVRQCGYKRGPKGEFAPPPPAAPECRPCACQRGPRRHGEFKHGGPGPRGEFKKGPRRGPKHFRKPAEAPKAEVKKPAEAPKAEVKKPAEAPKAEAKK